MSEGTAAGPGASAGPTVAGDAGGDTGGANVVDPAVAGGTDTGAGAAAPVDPRVAVNELLKKAGIKFKAGGKEVPVTDLESLIKYGQRGIGFDVESRKIQEQRKQLEPIAQMIQQLRNGDDGVQEQVLMKLLGSERFHGLAEKALRRKFSEEDEMSKLSPAERDMRQQMAKQQQELAALKEMRRQYEERQQQAAFEAQVHQAKTVIAAPVMKALELLDLPQELNGEAVDFMKPMLRYMVDNNIPIDPEVLVEKVGPLFDKLLQRRASKLDGEKLLKYFGDDIGKKYRQALLAQYQSKSGVKKPAGPNEVNVQGAPGAKRNAQEQKKWSWK